MVLIFHQNMEKFSGSNLLRNTAFNAGFTAIHGITGAIYVAAGFTEVVNNVASRVALQNLAVVLDAGLTNLLVIRVGTMAVSTDPEFIGIAWDPAFMNVQHAGQVLKEPVNKTWRVYNTLAPLAGFPNPHNINLPFAFPLVADSRGLAYIAGIGAGNPYILAFMHNMYAIGDKTGAFSNLNSMGQNIRNTIGGAYAGAEIIIGGDFNLPPRNPKRPRGAALTMNSRAAQAMGAYINTTTANPYDFWVVSHGGLANADCAVYPATRVPSASDHAAITINR